MDGLRESLNRAEKRLVEAGPVTHSLDVEEVRKLTRTALEGTAQIVKASRRVKQDVRRRKIAFSVVVVVIAVIIALLVLKRRRIKRAEQ